MKKGAHFIVSNAEVVSLPRCQYHPRKRFFAALQAIAPITGSVYLPVIGITGSNGKPS